MYTEPLVFREKQRELYALETVFSTLFFIERQFEKIQGKNKNLVLMFEKV